MKMANGSGAVRPSNRLTAWLRGLVPLPGRVPENALAVILCLILILLIITTANSAPQWIYQNF
jgi:hypothetical protein